MFKDDFHTFRNKVQQYSDKFDTMTEEATKNAIIMPFLVLLGYDVFDPEEIIPEYTCDVAGKKGEKIDYVILHDGEPTVLIEAKRAGLKLQKQQQGQLYRYFSTNRCRLAVLTNGITYSFFSDINAPNVMDDEPFLSFNILEDDEELFLSSLEQFHKSVFNVKDILTKAVFLKYLKVVEQTLRSDLINPSDELVKYFLSRPEIKTGNRITAQMIDKHRAATREAMLKVMGAVISVNTAAPEQAPQTDTGLNDIISSLPAGNEYRASDVYGVTNIQVIRDGRVIGRLRVSTYHVKPRYDYTELGGSGKLHFLTDADECEKYLDLATV